MAPFNTSVDCCNNPQNNELNISRSLVVDWPGDCFIHKLDQTITDIVILCRYTFGNVYSTSTLSVMHTLITKVLTPFKSKGIPGNEQSRYEIISHSKLVRLRVWQFRYKHTKALCMKGTQVVICRLVLPKEAPSHHALLLCSRNSNTIHFLGSWWRSTRLLLFMLVSLYTNPTGSL